MKNEDYKKIKKILRENGYYITLGQWNESGGSFSVQKKYFWYDVEFFKVKDKDTVYKLDNHEDMYLRDNIGRTFHVLLCQPSSEHDYSEYLKKEAIKRFGEIKSGDRFDPSTIDSKWSDDTDVNFTDGFSNDWWYDKEEDRLLVGGVLIYRQGKWAKRVKEKIKIDFYDYGFTAKTFTFKFKTENLKLNWEEANIIGNFLTKQLENYLNDQPGTTSLNITTTITKPTFPEDRS